MPDDIRVSIVGLDTSHAIEFTRRMQAPDCPEAQKVAGIRAIRCLRFSTPFYSEDGLDERQKQLEAWGVEVTRDFNTAVSDCDALILSINDPAYHLEYLSRCADVAKPMFLDKPLADTFEKGKAIYDIARSRQLSIFSSSSLRYVPQLSQALEAIPQPQSAHTYGPLGTAAAGSSIVWYGVHAFEMLQRALGRGAMGVYCRKDNAGAVALVEYADDRRGLVELTTGAHIYGGTLRDRGKAAPFVVDTSRFYSDELKHIVSFFRTGVSPVPLEDTLEIMALLDAAETSSQTGRPETVAPLP